MSKYAANQNFKPKQLVVLTRDQSVVKTGARGEILRRVKGSMLEVQFESGTRLCVNESYLRSNEQFEPVVPKNKTIDEAVETAKLLAPPLPMDKESFNKRRANLLTNDVLSDAEMNIYKGRLERRAEELDKKLKECRAELADLRYVKGRVAKRATQLVNLQIALSDEAITTELKALPGVKLIKGGFGGNNR